MIKSEPSECRTNLGATGDKCGSGSCSSVAATMTTSDKFSGNVVGSSAVDDATTPMDVDVKEEMDCDSPSSTKPVHALNKHLVSFVCYYPV